MKRKMRSLLVPLSTAAMLSWLLAVDAAPRAPEAQAGHSPPVTALAFSPDGKSLVAAQSNTILVLSGGDATLQRTVTPDAQRVTALAFRADGRVLAVAGGVPGESGRVLLLEWPSGRVIANDDKFNDVTTSVAFSPDGRAVAAAGADGTARLYSIPDSADRLNPLVQLRGHAGPVTSIVFDGGGTTVVTASGDRSIKVWDAADGTLQRTLSNHTGAVHCLARRPPPPGNAAPADRGTFACASGGEDETVRVWQPQVGRMVRIVRDHAGPVLAVCYAPDGSALFSAGTEGVVRMIDPDSDRVVRQWEAGADWIYAMAASPDGGLIATGAGELTLWRLGAGAPRIEGRYPPPPSHRTMHPPTKSGD